MALLDQLVRQAHQLGASDLHLEPGLPVAMRVGGRLKVQGEALAGNLLLSEARRMLPGDRWREFSARRSADLSRTVGGVRCRINILHSSRGVGFAVRLLAAFTATIDSLNLHPDLKALAHRQHGLVLVSGPTGSGKSSTVAALVQEINRTAARHVLTLEQPIEHLLRPRRAYIRQREVGRDTPSFEQGLLDALREDPDVIVVGEMRRPETMRLVLNAAETGHLVFSTLHSSNSTEALARLISSFEPAAQPGVCAQLAACLVAVVSQRLVLKPQLGIRVPELEVLMANEPTRAAIRGNQLHKLQGMLQTNAADGMWTFERYRRWLDQRGRFVVPKGTAVEPLPPDVEPMSAAPMVESTVPPLTTAPTTAPAPRSGTPARPASRPAASRKEDGVIDLDGYDEDLGSILSEL